MKSSFFAKKGIQYIISCKDLREKSCTSVMVFKRCIDNVTRARAFLPWFAVLKDSPFVKLLVSVVFQQQVF